MRIAVVSILAALSITCGGGGPAQPTPTPLATTVLVDGKFQLTAENSSLATSGKELNIEVGTDCSGKGGYSDINPGTEVLVSGDGQIVAKTVLGPGTVTKPFRSVVMGTRIGAATCDFAFQVEVPKGYKFYQVSVGRRGERTYTLDEITVPGALSFQLGGN